MIKTYETIYQKDSKNKTRIWYAEQNGSKYRMVSGLIDGQLVTTEWTIAEPKNIGKSNETSGTEQAALEIQSRYEKQLKTGYHKSINDIDKKLFVEPMLAQPWHKLSKKNIPDFNLQNWGLQCKYNGNRCVIKYDGLFSRTGERYHSVPHIEESLKPFFRKYPDAVLDGELFNMDLRQKLNEINELIRKSVHVTTEDIERSEKLIKFYGYDGYGFLGMDENTKYSERKSFIDKVVNEYKYLEQVKTVKVTSQEHMKELFSELIKNQHEGAILRNLDSFYEHKRSKNLVKLKLDEDDEAIIVDIAEGNGDWRNAATNVTLKWKNKVFDGVFKGSYDVRVKILQERNKWVGREVTFNYFGFTGLGTPNYARVDPANCFKNDR